MQRHANWIAGSSRPSRAGLERLVSRRLEDGGRTLGEWPVSGGEDLLEALAGLLPPDREPAELHGVLEAATVALEDATEGGPLAAGLQAAEACLGFEPGCLPAGLGTFGMGIGGVGLGRGAAVVVAHWTHGVRGLVTLLSGALLDRRPVLLVADPDLPMAAEVLVEALLAAGLPPRAVAVVFGARPEGLAALAAHPDVPAEWVGRMGLDRRAALEPFARDVPGLAATLATLEAPRAATWDLERRARDLGLDPEADLELLAEELVDAAFGPARGYHGLCHLTPLLAAVPGRVHAAFADAVLARFDGPLADRVAAGLPPVPGAGPDLIERQRVHWRRLVDEGAVLVAGGRTLRGPGGPRLEPTLLVEVDPRELRRPPGEPLAVLGLVRRPAHLAPGPKTPPRGA